MAVRDTTRVGLALAGGGPLGAIWEIGALCALADALPQLDFVALDGYVGVSAGSFLAAALANGMTPRQLCTAFIENDGPAADRVSPGIFMRPALGEFAQRAARLPGLALDAAWRLASRRDTALDALERLGHALPTGLFSPHAIESRLRRVFAAPGRSDDFRRLARPLVIVATDLDRGTAARFGSAGLDHVPISRAIAASAALPGLVPPVDIDGRWYVDGALKKTLHASVLLEQELDLVFCFNPLVPFDATQPGRRRGSQGGAGIPRLVEGGLPVVLAQTFRTMIHSRLELGLKGYQSSHPGTDIVLFEPERRDPTLFLAHTFGYRQRRALAEHAYQRTRADLRDRRGMLAAQLRRHGLALDDDVVDDPARQLVRPQRKPPTRMAGVLRRLDAVLDDLDAALPGVA